MRADEPLAWHGDCRALFREMGDALAWMVTVLLVGPPLLFGLVILAGGVLALTAALLPGKPRRVRTSVPCPWIERVVTVHLLVRRAGARPSDVVAGTGVSNPQRSGCAPDCAPEHDIAHSPLTGRCPATVETFAHDVRSLEDGDAIGRHLLGHRARVRPRDRPAHGRGLSWARSRAGDPERGPALPDSGLLTVVQGVTDLDGVITAVVRCGARPGCRRLSSIARVSMALRRLRVPATKSSIGGGTAQSVGLV
jgi:hypothetical protein